MNIEWMGPTDKGEYFGIVGTAGLFRIEPYGDKFDLQPWNLTPQKYSTFAYFDTLDDAKAKSVELLGLLEKYTDTL